MREGIAEVILSIVRGTERNNQTSVKVNYRMHGRVDNGKGMGDGGVRKRYSLKSRGKKAS